MIAIADSTGPTASVKSRKRAAVKTPQRAPAEKQKLTLYVTTEAAQRLAVHATMMNTDRSALVESLIQKELRRFVVSDRAKSADQATVEVSES